MILGVTGQYLITKTDAIYKKQKFYSHSYFPKLGFVLTENGVGSASQCELALTVSQLF